MTYIQEIPVFISTVAINSAIFSRAGWMSFPALFVELPPFQISKM